MSDLTSVEQNLVRLFDTPGYQWLIVLVALAAGAVHALKPGHGKSITAAYLVGAHGRVIHAVYLAFVVAAMHTATAILLAMLWQALRSVLPFEFGVMTAGLQVVAAVIVMAVGVTLVRRRRGAHDHHHHAPAPVPAVAHAPPAAGAPCYDHAQAPDHGHGHDLGHGDGHGHSHTSPEANPFTRRGLLALGLSGGLIPSPTVFIILVSGLVTGRVAFAVLLVVLFGVGMMLTIAAVGVLTLRGLRLVETTGHPTGRLATLARAMPGVAAYAVLTLGAVYLVVGVRGLLA